MWFKVKEVMPEERYIVLVYVPQNKTSYTAYWEYFDNDLQEDIQWVIAGGHGLQGDFEPTHWMTIPPDPEGA